MRTARPPGLLLHPSRTVTATVRGIIQAIKGSPYHKQTYNELFRLLVAVTKLIRRDGPIALDAHLAVRRPER